MRCVLRLERCSSRAYRIVPYSVTLTTMPQNCCVACYLLATPGGRSTAHLLISSTAAVSNDEPERLRFAFRQIEQRFGQLSDATVHHVRGSSVKQPERIARAILTAATLDEVLHR